MTLKSDEELFVVLADARAGAWLCDHLIKWHWDWKCLSNQRLYDGVELGRMCCRYYDSRIICEICPSYVLTASCMWTYDITLLIIYFLDCLPDSVVIDRP